MNQRFEDTGFRFDDFKDLILVQCPTCSGKAAVHHGKRLSCTGCGFNKEGNGAWCLNSENVEPPKIWYGAFRCREKSERTRCTRCGGDIALANKTLRAGIGRSDLMDGTCAACGHIDQYNITWRPYLQPGEARDPYFGASLLLQMPVKGGIAYAFNIAQAELYLAYFSATLRERGAPLGTQTMFTAMPGWMKAAKNRSALAGAYTKLCDQ